MQGRDSHDALEAQVVSRCAATASAASGMLVTARARQLAFVDLASAATAVLAQPEGTNSLLSCVAQTPCRCAIATQLINTYVA